MNIVWNVLVGIIVFIVASLLYMLFGLIGALFFLKKRSYEATGKDLFKGFICMSIFLVFMYGIGFLTNTYL